jgi:hypothetical protein
VWAVERPLSLWYEYVGKTEQGKTEGGETSHGKVCKCRNELQCCLPKPLVIQADSGEFLRTGKILVVTGVGVDAVVVALDVALPANLQSCRGPSPSSPNG